MIIKTKLSPISLLAIVILFIGLSNILSIAFSPTKLSNQSTNICVQQALPTRNNFNCGTTLSAYYCGIGTGRVATSIDFGCRGTSCHTVSSGKCQAISPITDMLFAVIRFLSVGVGLVIVASMVYAGIQYIASRGEPQATEHAMTRIRSNIIALVLFIFTYAILNFVIPPGFLN